MQKKSMFKKINKLNSYESYVYWETSPDDKCGLACPPLNNKKRMNYFILIINFSYIVGGSYGRREFRLTGCVSLIVVNDDSLSSSSSSLFYNKN